MSALRIFYLVATVIGGVLPMYYFISWFEANGYDLGAMVDAWNVNDASTGLVYDLTVSWVAFCVWVVAEVIATRRWVNLIALPGSLCVGLSFGLPLYLFLRSRP